MNKLTPVEKVIKELQAQPTDVKGQNNIGTGYYKRQLLRRLKGIFDIDIPEEWGWDVGYLLDHLILDGKVCFTDTPVGFIPLRCGLSGLNVFDRPSKVIITNPVLGQLDRTIGEDCVVMKLDDSYRGLDEIIRRYAQKLSSCDSGIDVSIMNSKVAMIFEVDNNKQAETAKLFFDKLSAGEPAIFMKAKNDALGNNGVNVHTNAVRNNFVADLLQIEKRKIMEEFLTEIGINNSNTDKKERLLDAEIASNNEEMACNIAMWKRNIDSAMKQIKMMFGVEFTFEIKTNINEGVSLTDDQKEVEENADNM